LTGKPMRRSNLRRSHFVPVCQAAGIAQFRIHDLRHSMTSFGLVLLPAFVCTAMKHPP